jgi:hypothetical protein
MEQELFRLNEILKEKLVTEYNCNKAITIYRAAGTLLIKESFYETEAFWKNVSDFRALTKKQGKDMAQSFSDLMEIVSKKGGQVTGPLFERHGEALVMVWGVFLAPSSFIP